MKILTASAHGLTAKLNKSNNERKTRSRYCTSGRSAQHREFREQALR